MKKILFLFATLALSVGAFAQNMQETVYLKNGSIIHGIIIEQVPSESLKIRTKDGNTFVFAMSDVEKITKENVYGKRHRSNRRTQYSRWSGPEIGYRGFVDLNWIGGVGTTSGVDCIGLLTSHGCQISPYLYTGLGIGFNYFYNGTAVNMPIFANVRTDLLQNSISPFVDIKVGYSVFDAEGFHFSPSVGCRFKVRDIAVNLGVGYTLQKFKFGIYDYDYWRGSLNLNGINIRFGIEF